METIVLFPLFFPTVAGTIKKKKRKKTRQQPFQILKTLCIDTNPLKQNNKCTCQQPFQILKLIFLCLVLP